MNRRQLGQCVVVLGLLAGMSSRADAQGVYHDQRLFIVPAPGKIVMDGNLKDWDLSGTIYTYVMEATAVLRYDVRSPFELVNSTPEQNMLFKGGNLLDIQLATDPAADPKRQKPAAGDHCVLVTRRDSKPLAVIYRPKQAGSQGQPTVFTSPTGQESIDRIEFWDNVKLQYAKTENGFQAVVCLPLARLGLTLKPGTVQRMDVGYIFGNPTGNTTALRAYWSNKSFTAGVTQDVPHEARLEPAQWGNATVE